MNSVALRCILGCILLSVSLAASAVSVPVGVPLSNANYDFLYYYGNPYDAASQTYIASTSNAHLYSEGTVRVWTPITGGSTLAGTTPGVITYHFNFAQYTSDIDLFMSMPTFHWAYSQGHNLLYGSTDGANWVSLADILPPAYGGARDLGTVVIPSSLLGATDFWLKAELYSYGPYAPSGGVYTNTAQLSRYDVNLRNTPFAIGVDFVTEGVPEPAVLPLLLIGLGGIAFYRRRVG